ncbi:MAG: hypothetical protein CL946_03030 [Ectothiorhodospiraceae bacterium]|nr:hypothetical protein [Ectothiorhodospiraceae bacterium]
MTNPVLIGIPDLMLSTRVNSAARALQIPTIATFTPHDLLAKAHGEEAQILLIDLEAEQLHPLDSIKQIRDDDHTKNITIVGFKRDVSAEDSKSAMNAGCSLVMTESSFISSLDDLLQGRIKGKLQA